MDLPIKLAEHVGGHFDYVFLMDALADYRQPHAKITQMLRSGLIIRVKKGLYVFGPNSHKPTYSKAVLGNLIYGPSYISLEYALAYHQMIPERVNVITSVTMKRRKRFDTPVGTFVYEHTRASRYPLGVLQLTIDGRQNILIASQEKALLDLLSMQRLIVSKGDLKQHLLENLRIPQEKLLGLNVHRLTKWARFYSNKAATLLPSCIKELS